MKKLLAMVAGTFSTVLPILSMPAMAASFDFDQVFAFGTSISDSGNFNNIFKNLTRVDFLPEPIYDDGRFSNGYNWVDYIAEDLGLNLTLSTELTSPAIPTDGINFAIGGAKTDHTHISGIPGLPGIQQQIDTFNTLLGGGTINNPQALAIIEGGSNDFLGGQLDPNVPADKLSEHIEDLIDAGLTNILVANMPDLGQTPLGLSLPFPLSDGLTQLSMGFNFLLDQKLDLLEQENPDVNFYRFDFYDFFKDLRTNPTQYGFTNITEGCTNINPQLLPDISYLEYQTGCSDNIADQDKFVFLDNQHPTTRTHRLMANKALKSVQVPESSGTMGLSLLGLGFLFNQIFSVYFVGKNK